MRTFHDAATIHYIRSSQLFHTTLCRAPALFLLSRSDPVGAEHTNRAVHDSWVKMGIEVNISLLLYNIVVFQNSLIRKIVP
jgi:hypothetical protein